MAVTRFQQVQYVLQVVCTFATVVLLLVLFPILIDAFKLDLWAAIGAFFIGILAADLASGIFHWGADTWGKQTWPIVGPAILKSFRDHHKTPLSILDHDFFETNGDACFGLVPLLIVSMSLGVSGPVAVGVFTFSLAILLTNQAHKYAHMHSPPAFIFFLQKSRVLLVRSDHQKHHSAPFVKSYCITTGWLNPLLNTLRFWRLLERAVTKVTGAIPREDEQ